MPQQHCHLVISNVLSSSASIYNPFILVNVTKVIETLTFVNVLTEPAIISYLDPLNYINVIVVCDRQVIVVGHFAIGYIIQPIGYTGSPYGYLTVNSFLY